MRDISKGHMMGIERAENICEIEKQTIVINYARNKNSVGRQYFEELSFLCFCVCQT